MSETLAFDRLKAARDLLLDTRGNLDQAVKNFVWPDVGPVFNWGIDWFDRIARGNAGLALVIVEEDGSRTTRTFDEMATRSDQLGWWLRSQGVERGDAVMLMLGNQAELWESMMALIKIGAIILPTTVAMSGDDLRSRIERGAVKHVIAGSADLYKFDALDVEFSRIRVGPGGGDWADFSEAFFAPAKPLPHPQNGSADPMMHYFTSGTTSQPKLVEHTHTSYPVGHLSTMYWLGMRPGDVHYNISSPGWAKHAWSCFFTPWLAESTVFVYNYGRFDATRMMEMLRAERVTSLCAPPTVWRMLIQADLSGGPGSLTQTISAGEPLNPEVIDQVRTHWGLTLRDGFGQTETTAMVANPPDQPTKDGSMGRPLPGTKVVLIDPVTGEETDGEGEICLDLRQSPPNVMTGYIGDPARTAKTMGDGYFHTGDIATRDEDGFLIYVGRTDDVFKSSDYKISPFELESVLIEHPAVVEAAIVPASDHIRLAVPKAYVSLAAGFEPTAETAEAILVYARGHLLPFQRVRRIEFFELPKTISGKIRRAELRQREERIAAGGEECREWRDDDFHAIKQNVAGG
ncbi:acetyl-CoA synthetase [Microbacterium sp. W4I4]|uniref:AMP-binding protein n=1 Tax=Microbacterium sp. W4I4 TaxID=3042295 RepID=UPI00277FE440|nr:AMP-binding protein [Microbacterium sp. W4I4]MDQ0615363.1 acetyl-CoA synthetase [Microbacterium sp. W4I4]